MRDVSDRWIETCKTGGELRAKLMCHPPEASGAEPFELTMASASISQDSGTGPRWDAKIDVEPEVGQDTWDLVSWPGSWFDLQVGWRYGPGTEELISYGQYVHRDSPTFELRNRISLDLADRWVDLDRAKYNVTYKPSSGSRTGKVQEAVRTALGEDQPISIRIDSGGSISGEVGWEERAQLIADLAKDGGFEAYFDYDGTFIVDDMPEIGRAVHTFSDSSEADIIDLSRGGRFTEFYNRVSVVPQNPEEIDFTPQVATLDEPNHPLDPRNMRGVYVVYKHSSSTIGSSSEASRVARRLLVKVMRQKLDREIRSYNLAHIEPGDTVKVALGASQTEPAAVIDWLVAKTSYDPLTGSSSLTLTSSLEPEIEQEAA